MNENDGHFVSLAEIDGLKSELRLARIKVNTAIFGVICALFLAIAALGQSRMFISPVATAKTGTQSLDYGVSQQDLTVHSIEIDDQNGEKTAVLDASGITFYKGNSEILFLRSTYGNTRIGPGYLWINGSNDDAPQLALENYGLILSTPGSDMTANYTIDGLSLDDSKYTITLGYTTDDLAISNDNHKKAHSDGRPIDQSTAIYGVNNISLRDSTGIVRTSIGQSALITPNKGATQTTALSSIVLFDTSGHVSWQTP